MPELTLPSGHTVFYDTEDHKLISTYKWYATSSSNGCIYARIGMCAKVKPPTGRAMMHRLLLGVPPLGYVIDHKNGNGLDNRRENLRFATRSQNSRNQKPQSQRYKGVTKDKQGWSARITLGTFKTPEEAALAYNSAATMLFGDFARLNEVPDA